MPKLELEKDRLLKLGYTLDDLRALIIAETETHILIDEDDSRWQAVRASLLNQKKVDAVLAAIPIAEPQPTPEVITEVKPELPKNRKGCGCSRS